MRIPNPLTYALVELMAWTRKRFFNPTRQWPVRQVSRLVFDLTGHTLCGVRIGAPIAEARAFGPADRIIGPSSAPDLLYYSLGLHLECFEGSIVGVRLIMDPRSRDISWDRCFTPASLVLQTADDSVHTVSRQTCEKDLFVLFGQPAETGPVCSDRVHTFVVEGNVVDSFHAPTSGLLTELTITIAAGAVDPS